MASSTGLLEAMIRRDRLVLVAGMLVVLALAWGWLVLGAGMDMSAIEMTRMAGMDGWMMEQAVWTPAYALLIVSMWWVMMLAMMLPGAAPMLLLFARVNRKEGAAGSPLIPAGAFATGYLIAWGGFSIVAAGLQWALETAWLMSPMLQTTNVWLGAAILVGAGLWQLTPLKTMCLRHCRSPLGFLIGHWRTGRLGALRMGCVLSRVLLVPDGAPVLRRRDELILDRRPCDFRTAGKDHSARPLARPRGGRRFDRVGSTSADALTAAERDWLSTILVNPA